MEDLSQTIHAALALAGWGETPHPSRACVSLLINPNYPGIRLGLSGNSVEIYLTQQAHKAEYAHCADSADQIDGMLVTMHRALVSRYGGDVERAKAVEQARHPALLERLNSLVSEWKESSKQFMSGYIDPSEADSAREEGKREAYAEVADELYNVISEYTKDSVQT